MFFKKNETKNNNFLTKVCALLIHAAKIDENYTDKEEKIIKDALEKLGLENENISKTIQEAKEVEENSNQILDFTKEVKNLPEKDKVKIIEENSNQILEFTREVKNLAEEDKIKIIEALWSIIYSNKDADIYETNLMRRLAGLLYIDSKTMGDIKNRIQNQKS